MHAWFQINIMLTSEHWLIAILLYNVWTHLVLNIFLEMVRRVYKFGCLLWVIIDKWNKYILTIIKVFWTKNVEIFLSQILYKVHYKRKYFSSSIHCSEQYTKMVTYSFITETSSFNEIRLSSTSELGKNWSLMFW